MTDNTEKLAALDRVINVLEMLRKRCPWDREQTTESIRANTIEEVYELSEAILQGDIDAQCKELGDVLLHILFYSKIAEEKGFFDLAEVCNRLSNKLIYRHPHVYGAIIASEKETVVQNWERLKQKEKGGNKTVLGGVPVSLPSMIKAYRIQDKARAVGFDWEHKEQVWDKVKEEIQELEQELRSGVSAQRAQEEFGDVIFALINAARLYDINPDDALEGANRRFVSRFSFVEEQARREGKPIDSYSLAQLDIWWEQAKKREQTES